MEKYSLAEELANLERKYGIRSNPTVEETNAMAMAKGSIIFELAERLFEAAKNVPRNKPIANFEIDLGEFNDNGDSQAVLDYHEREMQRNYILELKEKGVIRDVSYGFRKVPRNESISGEVETAKISCDVRALKKYLKKAVQAKKKLKGRPRYSENTGFLVAYDKHLRFKGKYKLLLDALWGSRRILAGSNLGSGVVQGGTLIGIEELVEVVLGIKSDATKTQKNKVKQYVYDIRKRLKGLPIKIAYRNSKFQLIIYDL